MILKLNLQSLKNKFGFTASLSDISLVKTVKMASRSEGELPSSSDDSSRDSSSSSSDEEQVDKKPTESALKFKNDGSFLEMFKKMQEGKKEEPNSKESAERLMTNNEVSPSSSDQKVTKPLETTKKPGLMSIVSFVLPSKFTVIPSGK